MYFHSAGQFRIILRLCNVARSFDNSRKTADFKMVEIEPFITVTMYDKKEDTLPFSLGALNIYLFI